MATTNFISGTIIQPSWLNPVDSASYNGTGAQTGGAGAAGCIVIYEYS